VFVCAFQRALYARAIQHITLGQVAVPAGFASAVFIQALFSSLHAGDNLHVDTSRFVIDIGDFRSGSKKYQPYKDNYYLEGTNRYEKTARRRSDGVFSEDQEWKKITSSGFVFTHSLDLQALKSPFINALPGILRFPVKWVWM